MKENKFFLTLLFLFTLLILLNPKLALEGAKNGLLLWFQSVLPALLPFMILSGILVETRMLLPFCRRLQPILKHLFPISPEGCIPLFLGFFCGFPMGARVISDLRKSRQITSSEAQYLLGFCNNFSPAFLTGFVKTYLPGVPIWNLFLVVFGSSLLYGILAGKRAVRSSPVPCPSEKRIKDRASNTSGLQAKPSKLRTSKGDTFFSFSLIDDAIMRGFSSITKLGGYLMLFGIFAKMVTAVKAVTILKAILLTITEITTSIPYTASTLTNPALRELILLPGLVFGGISGIAQTKSMIANDGLSVKKYAAARLKITGIALFLTYGCILLRSLPV